MSFWYGRSRSSGPRVILLVTVLVVGVGLAGCTTMFGEEEPLPEGTDAADQMTELEGYSATVLTNVSTPNGTERYRYDLQMAPASSKYRFEVMAPPAREGNVVLSNGTVTWRYNATTGNATRTEHEGIDQATLDRQYLERLVDSSTSDETFEADPGSISVSPVPVVPGASGSGGDSTTVKVAQLRVDYRGTDTVAGRDAYVIDLHAADESGPRYNRTVWLDQEYFVTLRQHLVVETGDRRREMTSRHENVTFGPDFDAGTFQFDTSRDVRLTGDFETTAYDSRSELAANTDLRVPEPDLSAGYSLLLAQTFASEDARGVELVYQRAVSTITVGSLIDENRAEPTEYGDPIDLGNVTAYYERQGEAGRIYWVCAEKAYVVSGDVSRETLRSVAESIGCPRA